MLLTFCVPVSLHGQQDDSDERSVLISSRKAERGGQQASPPGDAAMELDEPLAPVAVATDQSPKLAAPPAADIPNELPSAPTDSLRERLSPAFTEATPSAPEPPLAGEANDPPAAEDIETAKFNGVQPGATTADQLRHAWGEPQQRVQMGGMQERWIYDLKPFKNVQVDLSAGEGAHIVRSIQLELEQQVGPTQLGRQLRLDRFRPASIRDAQGTELGIVYPERGVVFSYAPQADEPVISHVLLEPVSAQPFVLRAEQNLHGPYRENLRDLETATELDPQLAQAWCEIAAVELAIGRFTAAEAAAKSAVDADPLDGEYRLRWAACLAQLDRHQEAVTETRRVAESPDARPHVRAEALVQLGRLQAIVPAAGQEAMKHYQQAIEIAGELSTSQEADERRAAKAVLVAAHLGVAQEIAQGQWREKEKVVPLWLERASAFAEDMIRTEGAEPDVRLSVAIGALEALGAFPPSAGPGEWVREAQTAIDAMLARDDDELWQGRVHWEAGQAYLHAIRVEHARGKPDDALQYGQTAITHFRDGARLREASPLGEHLVGRLYFHLGAVHAIHFQDHERAVIWYEKAAPLLVRTTPQVPGADWRIHGDALVSMGVSYWESGAQDRALELTQRGADVLQTGVQAGVLDEASLSVAYGNLANMHKLLGHQSEADRFIQIAERVEGTSRQ
jgi:tetratricopeptide (TPR) repeat protein